MENRFRMTDRIWELNTEAARAGQSQGHPLTLLNLQICFSPPQSPAGCQALGSAGCQERGGDPSVTQDLEERTS